jgi:hypothetical protein
MHSHLSTMRQNLPSRFSISSIAKSPKEIKTDLKMGKVYVFSKLA